MKNFEKKHFISNLIKKILFSRYQNDIRMNSKILFSEQQKFRQPWHWLLLILVGIPGVFIWRIVQQAIPEPSNGNTQTDYALLIFSAVIVTLAVVLLVIVLLFACLETTVTSTEISIKFFPFHRSFRHYKREDIAKASIQKINPLKNKEWGSFGLNMGYHGIKIKNFSGNHLLFSVAGKYVLKLELTNGKTITIGTQKEKELEAVIDKIM